VIVCRTTSTVIGSTTRVTTAISPLLARLL
jgi:hypothetical protein